MLDPIVASPRGVRPGLSSPSMFAALALLAACASVAPVAAAEGSARVTGVVLDEQGQPVPGLVLVFEPFQDPRASKVETKTKKNGKFIIGAFPLGQYFPTVAGSEYVIKTVTFVVRSPDGRKVSENKGEADAAGRVPAFTSMSNMRGTVDLVVSKDTSKSREFAQLEAAKDTSGDLKALNELFEAQQWTPLLAECDKVLAEHPEVGGVLFLRGVALWRLDRLEEAEETLQRAIPLAPEQPGLRGALGSVMLDQGSRLAEAGQEQEAKAVFGAAADMLQEELMEHPGSITFLSNRVVALERAGRLDDTLAAIEELIEEDPTSLVAYVRAAQLLIEAERAAEALAVLDRAPEPNKAVADEIYNAAIVVYNAGDMDVTIEAMNRALAIAPEEPMLFRLRGRAYLAKGDDATGIADLKEYLKRVPEDDPVAETDRALVQALGG